MTDYVISDLHLEHFNCIRYGNRPFESLEEMDAALINNWNSTVQGNDVVYFLGDLTIKNNRFYENLNKLNGVKRLVKGNHDKNVSESIPDAILEIIDGMEILFIHSPWQVPEGYTGWVIHGHVHNNRPFFDPLRKRVNVSAERVDYTPVPMDQIIGMIKEVESFHQCTRYQTIAEVTA